MEKSGTTPSPEGIESWRIKPGKTEEFYAILDDALDVGVAILDENLCYQYMNQGMIRELDLKPNELSVGDPLEKCHALMLEKGIIKPGHFEEHGMTAAEQKTRNSGLNPNLENLTVFSDGTVHRLVRKQTPNGYTVSMSHDVTALMQTEAMLDQALDLGNAGYWTFDFKSQEFKISNSLRRMFNSKMLEVVDSDGLLGMVDEEDRPLFLQAMKMMSKTKGKIEVTSRTTHPEKGLLWFRTIGQAERDQDGNWSTMRAFVKDITEERRQAKELEKAKDEAVAASIAKSEFLANMSHEIRTPMNGVLGMAELLAATEVDDRQQEFIKVITRSSNALLTIINDILDFSKIEAGAFDLDPIPFNLQDALDDVAALLSTAAHEKGLELIMRYPSTMPSHFIGDVGRLRQVVTNLIGNAIKFTEEGHVVVDVGLGSSDTDEIAQLTLNVTDTGIGIEPDKLESIFEKFTQADGSTTRLYGGTGLGLTISRHIIELMGGTVSAQSTYGDGSVFTLNIPLKPDQSKARKTLDITRLAGKRALIIDDIDLNRSILEQHLDSWGMTTYCAKDGVEALVALKGAVASDNPFDVIITDYLMPGINGRELATVISNNSEISGTPTIMLSSADQPTSSVELAKIGIDIYMVKPVREASLHAALTNVLSTVVDNPVETTIEDFEAEIVSDMIQKAAIPKPLDPSLTQQVAPVLAPVSAPVPVQAPAPKPVIQKTVNLEFETAPAARAENTLRRRSSDFTDIRVSQTIMASSTSQPVEKKPESIEILVAEDFQLNQDVVALMLQDTLYSPVFAANGKLAVDLYMAEPERFGAILMDISMPVMDGYEASEIIMAFEQLNTVEPTPIIALTGHALKHDREKCLGSNMCDYLTKPVKQSDLLASLNRWCGQVDPNTVAPRLHG